MQLTVHIGAHRTGSTLVAQAITASVEAYPACGVAVWHPRHMRDIGGWQAVPRSYTEGGAPVSQSAGGVMAGLKRRLASDARSEEERGIHHIVISEENLMGTMRTNMKQGTFYTDVQARLRAYDHILPMAPTRVALGVRDYGSVWASAFHYIPQAGKERPQRKAARSALLSYTRGWTDVIEDIYTVWPTTEVYVWQQEDLEDHAAYICAGLLEIPQDQIVLPEKRVNRLEEADARRDLFLPEERALLSQRYTAHMNAIRSCVASPTQAADP